jgi:nitrogen fixation/metabolism regulation signal transduction histidine kinase
MEAFQLHAGDHEKRAVSRALRLALFGSVSMAVVLLVVLASATSNTALFQEHYPLLLTMSGVVGVALLALVAELMRRLVSRYRRGLFGTQLMVRMASVFVLMTVLPVVAVQFIGRSIESWFDVPVERALESGISLGRASLDALQADITAKARSIARDLSDEPASQWPQSLNRLRDQSGVQDALIATASAGIVTASGATLAQLVPDLPPPSAIRQARITRLYVAFESDENRPDKPMQLRVVVPINLDAARIDEIRYLQLVQPLPRSLASNATAVQQGFAGYKALSTTRAELKRLYGITLTLIFLLTLFSAVAAAFVLAGWLTGPLSDLAAATRAVAEGDFRPVKDYAGRGELGVLTRSFNGMTRQLQEARGQVDRKQRELEAVNARLESVLANLTAGVMVFDADLSLTLVNPGAERILDVDLGNWVGHRIADIPRVGELAEEVRSAFNEQVAAGQSSWQRQFSLRRDAGPGERAPDGSAHQTILARGSLLPERRVGYVIVFDDISQLISAQRALAWSEVARRLAHEIKNPLTPIQLAAERLQRKLADKLPVPEAEFLNKSAQTIINQVAALSFMVDEFRDYARLPAAQLQPLDLNALIEEVLHLYSGLSRKVTLRLELAPALPQVLGDRTQLRQVMHNLLKNAIEAVEARPAPTVEILTEALILPDGAPAARVSVRDNGEGFSAAMLARAFEPYVTTKAKGTGLGLAIVKKVVDEHGAHLDVSNRSDPDGRLIGAQVSILFTKLPKSVDNPAEQARVR